MTGPLLPCKFICLGFPSIWGGSFFKGGDFVLIQSMVTEMSFTKVNVNVLAQKAGPFPAGAGTMAPAPGSIPAK